MNIHKLFTAEPSINERYRWLASSFVIIFAVGYGVSFLGLMQHVAYLGPGLGDDFDFSPYLSVFDYFYVQAKGNWFYLPLLLFSLLSFVNVMFTIVIVALGYTLYPRLVGKPFPITVLFTYFSLNSISSLGIIGIHVLIALVAMSLGYDFVEGMNAFKELLINLRTWAQQVPTLIDMPAWLAFFVLQMVGGFFHYWFHRLAHESRLLWLLFHRTHHMTPELIQPSTQAVFNAFPFFIFAAVPYVVIFSVIGKLITSDSILIYLIIYKLLSAFSNLFSHQTAFFMWAKTKWIIRAINIITSEGVYHYMHHSAEDEHTRARGNLVNIGGGLFFFWDWVFGTFQDVSDERPRVGLQGIAHEEMSTNPLRLAFSGIAQMLYEVRYNFTIKDLFLIVFGTSNFRPEHSKNYVLSERAIQTRAGAKSTI